MASKIIIEKKCVCLFIQCFAAFFIFLGCAGESQGSFDLITLGKNIGIRKKFKRAQFFDAKYDAIFLFLLESLVERGSQICTADRNSGLISWSDSGISFIAIPSQMRKNGKNGIVPKTVSSQRIVNGSGRIFSSNGGTWLYFHTSGREIESKKMIMSDGTYEHNLLKHIENKVLLEYNKSKNYEYNMSSFITTIKPEDNTIISYNTVFAKPRVNLLHIKASRVKEKGIYT